MLYWFHNHVKQQLNLIKFMLTTVFISKILLEHCFIKASYSNLCERIYRYKAWEYIAFCSGQFQACQIWQFLMKLVLSTIFFEYFLVLGKERLEHTLYKFYANMIPVRNGKSPLSNIIHVYEIIFTYTYAHTHTLIYTCLYIHTHIHMHICIHSILALGLFI